MHACGEREREREKEREREGKMQAIECVIYCI